MGLPELKPETVSREEIGGLLTVVERNGYIPPLSPRQDAEGVTILRTWGKQEEIPLDQATSFFRARLTEEGQEFLQKTAEETGLDLEIPQDFFAALRTVPKPVEPEEISKPEVGVRRKIEKIRRELRELIPRRQPAVEEGEIIPIDEELKKALEKGPSHLIEEEVIRHLTIAKGGVAGKVPLKAWLLNPKAAVQVLGAIAEEAATQAQVRKTISETAKWITEVAGDDARRDALLNYTENLEGTLGPSYLKPFCKDRNLPVPEEKSLARMGLLLRINAEMRALQIRAQEITKKGELFVREQVGIQAEGARNRMLVEELPLTLEAVEKASPLEREWDWLRWRNRLAKGAGYVVTTGMGPIIGVVGSLSQGAVNLLKTNPECIAGAGVAVGTLVAGTVALEVPLSGEVISNFLLPRAALYGTLAWAGGLVLRAGGEYVSEKVFRKKQMVKVPEEKK